VHEDVESFGLGSESLSVAYAKLHASHLVEDLRDNGRMGIITRAMLNMQLKLVGSCDKGTDALRSNAKYCLRVRQLSQMHENDIILMKDEEPQFTRSAHIVEALQTLNPNGPTHPKDKARKKQSLHREAVKANDVGVRQPTVDCCPCQNHSYKEAQAKKLMHDNKNTTRGQKAAIVIEKLYGHTNQIAAIRGWRMAMENTVTGKRPRTNKPSQRERIQQIQFEVEWAPTYVEEWALHYYELAGYKPRSTTACHRMDFAGRDLNPLEWACTAACEVCWSPDSREYDAEADCHDDLFACNSCEKHYHAECIGQRGWRPQTAQWQCPACINGRFSRAPHPVGKLVRVEWEPSWEPEETLVSTPGGKALLERWIKENHHQPPARMTEKPLDAHLSNLERQGFKTVGEDRWKTTMGDPIRELIHFEMEAINPQLDVHPSTTGECKIEIRTIEMWDKGNPDQPKMRRMACIHKPNGKCVGTVSPYRLLTLRKLFDAALSSGQHSKMTPKPASFEKEMVDMILRHKLKKITKQKQPSPWMIKVGTLI
jgi:hypothetical protein